MDARELMLLDLQETRRRFLIVARSIPAEYLSWKPDAEALSIGAMIRHVLFHDYFWLVILTEGRILTAEERAPFWDAPFTTVEAEIERAQPYHEAFAAYVRSLEPAEYGTRVVQWPHKPLARSLGDALERKSYHDAVHTGQLLQYLRTLQLPRPDIWD